jgi:hypothetical protein
VFGKAKEKVCNGNSEQIYRAFVHVTDLKHIYRAFLVVNRLNIFE